MERSKEELTLDLEVALSPVDYDTDFSEAVKTSWGEQARTRVSGTDTANSICIFEYTALPGFGPPRHLHHLEDEIFFIREGQIVVWTSEKTYKAGPGDLVLLKKNIAHTWKSYGKTPLRAVVTVTPSGFERFFSIIEERGLVATDIDALNIVAREVGLDVVGPPLTDDEVDEILLG